MAETTPNNVSAAPPTPRDAESNKPAGKQETKKIVRLLTVVAYMMSVSMAAFMLSAYYIFLWNPKEHKVTAPLRLVDPCPDCYLPAAGNVNHDQMNQLPVNLSVNDSQMGETPRALPAKEHLPAATTPLSGLVIEPLQQDQETNYTEPELVHS